MSKIFELQNLATHLSQFRKNKRIILCHGVFDVIHSGHIIHFRQAKKNSNDILVVSVTADEFVNKGPNRPVFNLKSRMHNLSELNIVDYIVPSYSENSSLIISKLKPNIYIKGKDHNNKIKLSASNMIKEKSALLSVGGKIQFTDTLKLSSTKILNKKYDYLNFEQREYVKNLSLTSSKINLLFKNISKLKILVAGEIIVDEYIVGQAVGKSSKDPIIVLNEKYTSQFAGGVAAIVQNLKSFSKNIVLTSLVSKTENNYLKLINEISKKIKFLKVFEKNFQTISKKRIIDEQSNQRMIGLYKVPNVTISKKNQNMLIKKLITENLNKKFDLAILLNYGHGFFNEGFIKKIYKICPNSYVNAQINSMSQKSISVDLFSNSKTIVINENELRTYLSNNHDSLDKLSKYFFKKVKCLSLVVTSGKNGSSLYYKKNNKKIVCPAFGDKIIDKTGAGDTFLTFFSLMKTANCKDEESLFFASIAAAESLRFIGNSKIITLENLKSAIESYIN